MTKSFKKAAPQKFKAKNAVISILLVAALVVTGALAYLTATDSANNTFTVGNVDITLTEPLWDEANPDGVLENITPGQVITKDPTIENTGKNNAFVYVMVEVPKADAIAIDGEIVNDHQLFSYTTNAGWTLIDSKVDENDLNNYYLYAYDAALVPSVPGTPSAVTLFNSVTFANVTSDYEVESLAIKVTGYAIQSDFYNKEAGETATPASAWELYATQNNWKFPNNPAPIVVPEGMSALNFVSEDGAIVHTEIAEAGTPVEMYFEPELAKDGYTFDWVDETTGNVAYSGMPMPEENTNLLADYTATEYGSVTSDFLKYSIYKDDNGELYACAIDADISHENFPTSPTAIIIPSYIIYQKEMVNPSIPTFNITTPNAASVIIDRSARDTMNALSDVTINIPVKKVSISYGKPELTAVMESLVIPDTVTSVSSLPRAESSAQAENTVLKSVNIPYGTTELGSQLFLNFTALENIELPQSLTSIGSYAFEGSGLKNIVIPQSVQSIGGEIFRYCNSLETIEMPLTKNTNGIIASECAALKTLIIHAQNGDTIGQSAFASCPNLETVILPEGLKVIKESAFMGAAKLENITLPNSLETIENLAFQDTALTSVSVPSTCTVTSLAFPSSCEITYR